MIKSLVRAVSSTLGYDLRVSANRKFSNPASLEKANLHLERFREVVSDPLNLLIERVPDAGYVDEHGRVILHNGNRVPITGQYAYYEDFSDLLVINRGVHEPLEEFCFQTMLAKLEPETPVMIELGAYWAHYSMWLQKLRPRATCYMVEPDPRNLACGKNNFVTNQYRGEFIQDIVGSKGFRLDAFCRERQIAKLDILHSDIQGHEVEMLEDSQALLAENRIDHIFISTHSEDLHESVVAKLRSHSYRIEVSSGFDTHTTSCDGFIMATSSRMAPVFASFSPLGRIDIARSSSAQLMRSLTSIET